MSRFNRIKTKFVDVLRRNNPWGAWTNFEEEWSRLKSRLHLDEIFDSSPNSEPSQETQAGYPRIYLTLRKLEFLQENRGVFSFRNTALAKNTFSKRYEELSQARALYESIKRLVGTRNTYKGSIGWVLLANVAAIATVLTFGAIAVPSALCLSLITLIEIRSSLRSRNSIRECEEQMERQLKYIDDRGSTDIVGAMHHMVDLHTQIQGEIDPLFDRLGVDQKDLERNPLDSPPAINLAPLSIPLESLNLSDEQRERLTGFKASYVIDVPAPIQQSMTTQFDASKKQTPVPHEPLTELFVATPGANVSPAFKH